MPYLIAVLFEDKIEASYIAVKLEGEEPEILFMKGPEFKKTMGPFPVHYAEATFKKWNYCMVENPPAIELSDKKLILDVLAHMKKQNLNSAKYYP